MTKNENSLEIYAWLVCFIAAIFYCYEYVLRILPSVIMPELMETYQCNSAMLGHLVGSYYYAYAPAQILVGLMMDRLQPRWVLTSACMLCVIGSMMFSWTHLYWVGFVGRFLVGFGSAFAFVGVLKLASIWLPPERMAFISGITTLLGMLSAMFGEIILSEFTSMYLWQWVNQNLIWSGLVLSIMIWLTIKPFARSQQTDAQEKNSILHTLKQIAQNPQIWLCGIIGFCMFASLSVFAETYGLTSITALYGVSHQDSAWMTSMVFLGWAIGAPLFGFLSDHTRRRVKPLRYNILIAFVAISISIYAAPLPIYVGYLLFFVYGLCCSAEVIIFAIGRESSAPSNTATALTVINMLVMLSGMMFQPLVGMLLDYLHGMNAADSFKIVFSVLPSVLLIAYILSYFLTETHAEQQVQ